MSKLTVIVNFITAFVIVAGTGLGVALIGGTPTKWQVIGSIVAGLVAGAKDTRSLLKLPPVETDNQTNSQQIKP